VKDASVSILAMICAVQTFGAFLPNFAEAHDKMLGSDGTVRADVRHGEVVASTLALSFGVLASSMSDDPRPALFTLAVTAGVVVAYEMLLRDPAAGAQTSQVTA
jgi:hypothetical protein